MIRHILHIENRLIQLSDSQGNNERTDDCSNKVHKQMVTNWIKLAFFKCSQIGPVEG